MEILNKILGGVFDTLLLPFRELPPLVGLTLVSVLTAVGMLLVFKATSDQRALAAVKRQISAGIFEIRLFSDDPRAILSTQVDILGHSFRYLRLSIVPTLWMIIPLVLAIIQLQYHYGYQGLQPGAAAIVKVELEPGSYKASGSFFVLEAPPGLDVETQPLWIPSLNEVAWRIRAKDTGEHQLQLRVGDAAFSKRVDVSNSIVRRSSVRASGSLVDQLLYPAEAPIRDGPVRSISVGYPEAEVSLLGWKTHWVIVYFILTMVAAFALRRPFGVTI